MKIKIRSSGVTGERRDGDDRPLCRLSMLPVSGMAMSHLLSPRTAPSDLRATVSCLCGSALLAAEPASPYELLPAISGVQGVGSGQG